MKAKYVVLSNVSGNRKIYIRAHSITYRTVTLVPYVGDVRCTKSNLKPLNSVLKIKYVKGPASYTCNKAVSLSAIRKCALKYTFLCNLSDVE